MPTIRNVHLHISFAVHVVHENCFEDWQITKNTKTNHACLTTCEQCCNSSFSLVITVAISELPKFHPLNTDSQTE